MKKFKSYLSQDEMSEATEYYQGEHGFDYIEQTAGIKLRKFLKRFTLAEIRKMYIQVKDLKLTQTVVIKLPGEDCAFLNTIVDKLTTISESEINEDYAPINVKKCNSVDFKVQGVTLRFYLSGGRLQNITTHDGQELSAKTPTTAQQEQAVVFALNQKKYPTDQEIRDNQGFHFGPDWLKSFKGTYDVLASKLDLGKYTTWRDSDKRKPNFLNRMTQDDILPDKKDNWNPADIWIIKNGYKGKDIDDVVTNIEDNIADITELNHLVNARLDSGDLIGVSLKKVQGTPKFEKITVDSASIKSVKFKSIEGGQNMSALNSYFDINYIMENNSNDIMYYIRFRPRGKSGALSVYFEGQPKGTTVRDGAFSKDMLNKKYFKGADTKARKYLEKINEDFSSVLECSRYLADFLDDDKFYKFMKSGAKNPFINITDITKKEKNHYKMTRGVMLSYYIYLISYINEKDFLRDGYLSSKKMNDFSSVHYKIS